MVTHAMRIFPRHKEAFEKIQQAKQASAHDHVEQRLDDMAKATEEQQRRLRRLEIEVAINRPQKGVEDE